MSFGVAEGLAVIIASATAMAFLARKTGQPTVIAYIITGLFLGPAGLNIVSETDLTYLLSELGLVFLLFLIGLEIDLEEIKEILRPTAVIGALQIASTFISGVLIALLLGFGVTDALFIGAAVMFSSTALVVKLLSDKNEASTLPGRLDIGVLLIQDIVVVLLLALLATGMGSLSELAVDFTKIVGIVVAISFLAIAGGRYVLPHIFNSPHNNPHTFFIYGVAWAFIFISSSMKMNISAEIGAFVAGLGLAQLPYDRELQERVRPLTDFFMAIFFINFGLNIAAGHLSTIFFEAVVAAFLLMGVKFLIFFFLIDGQKFTPETSFIGSVNMMQISEFGLILGGLAYSKGFVGQEIVGFLSLVAIITMGISSYLIRFNHRVHEIAKPYLERFESEEKQDVEVRRLENHAVIVGFDQTMRNLVPVLEREFEDVVVVDNDSDKTAELSEMGVEYIYGDFLHGEIRNSSGIARANIIVTGAPDLQLNKKIAEEVPEEVTLFLKAENFEDAAELYEMGAHYVIIENVIAADQVADYVELLLDERDLFMEEVESDLEKIYWGGRGG